MLDELERDGRALFRAEGKQIALFRTDHGVLACNNRCPHEGYPLREGDLGDDCVLTCNWHNWKFDLRSGANLYGGDRLRIYPTEIRNGEVWVDVAERPFEERLEEAKANLRDAFEDNDYARMARELGRLRLIGADPLDGLRDAIRWSHDRLEFGWTHAYAGAADWLSLHDEVADDDERRLVCVLESVAHVADDVLREPCHAYVDAEVSYDEAGFVDAVEREDEARAVAMIRGALRQGIAFDALEPGLTRAALMHYNDFGHSLIYVNKARKLIARLDDTVAEPLLLALVRGLVYARREDRIPEFRAYAGALARWGKGSGGRGPDMRSWRGLGIAEALETTIAASAAAPERLYSALLGANAWNMLAFDVGRQDRVEIPVSDNVGWLDFTHAITFANAVREQCTRFPELWPAGLLQLACFSGRNASFTEPRAELERWRVADIDGFFDQAIEGLFDHGREEFIVSVHLLKTLLAARAEIRAGQPPEISGCLAAAINRFLGSPMKRKHVRRTVYQAMKFVALDG